MPTELAESKVDKYSSLEEVIVRFIESCWESNIDGIEIDWKS